MTDYSKVKLTVEKMSCAVPLNLDEDGTPMYHGERLVEVEPGKWMHPDAIAIHDFLHKAWERLAEGGWSL